MTTPNPASDERLVDELVSAVGDCENCEMDDEEEVAACEQKYATARTALLKRLAELREAAMSKSV
jgi:hypothetical protein